MCRTLAGFARRTRDGAEACGGGLCGAAGESVLSDRTASGIGFSAEWQASRGRCSGSQELTGPLTAEARTRDAEAYVTAAW